MSVLQGLKLLQIGNGLAAAVCGRLFADMGADVLCIDPAKGTPLSDHLNADKRIVDEIPSDIRLAVLEGAPGALAADGRDAASMRRRLPAATLVYISPYGQTGPDADRPATDLTLFCASGIARVLTGQVDDLSEPPIRAVGEQSAFIGGLAAACAGMHGVLRPGSGCVIDVSMQEALATLSMTELTRAGLGGNGWQRRRLTDGNGATVCILPANDGYAAISPREDHQWASWLAAMGDPEWGGDPKFATKPDRVQNWDALHGLMSEWSRRLGKSAISELAQGAHVPSFPLHEPTAHLTAPQFEHRNSFSIRNVIGNSLKTINNPFGLSLRPAPRPGTRAAPGGLPLAGVRVLDFSWVIAGPTATRYLAAMGAEVIKVEAPGKGDPGRGSELHTVLGQGKQGIVLNLKHDRAKAVARDLAAECDVLIENFATGVMDRLGLGAEALQARHPGLIYISASGMGRTGPDAKAVAYGTLLQCYTGFAGLNRHPDRPPRVGMAWLDPMCGLKLAFIAAAALWRRVRTGEAARVDFSMTEAMLWTMAAPLLQAQIDGGVTPQGNTSVRYAPHGIYPAAGDDAWLGLAARNDSEWISLAKLVPRLRPLAGLGLQDRKSRADEIDDAIAAWSRTDDPETLARTLNGHGIPAAALATTAGLAGESHLAARGFWEPVEGGALPGLPWQADFGRASGAAPGLGAQTDAILRDLLGYAPSEIAELRAQGAIA